MKKPISYTAFLLLLFPVLVSAQADIATARSMPLNSTVIIRGIVINGSELGPIRYVEDATGGIAIYGSNLASVNRGDSIVATGTLTDYNNLLEVQPISSFTVFTPVAAAPAPQLITPSQMGEPLEGQLVRINGAVFSNGGQFAGNTSYAFTSNSQSGVIYVRTGSPLVGVTIPIGPVSVIGVMSQFLTTYQLLPRDAADIFSTSSIVITTQVTQSNLSTSGFDLGWTTNISGSTFIRYGLTPALELGTLNGAAGINHMVSVTNANPSDIFFVQACSVSGTDTAFSPVRAYATVSASTGWIKVYFNNSVDTSYSTGTDAVQLYDAIDDTLIAYINRAQYSIDFTIYHFDNQNISNISTALNNAHNRGVRVRLIVDSSYIHPAIYQLDPAIPVLLSPIGGSYGIMHNKFVVFDAKSPNPDDVVLWTGSTNFAPSQIDTDANNVIIFQDQSIAKGYTIEFEEMWGDTGLMPNPAASHFGPFKINNTPHEYLIGGIRVEQYFSPSDGVNSKILEKIGTANTDLCVETMEITRADIAAALVAANAAGIDTYVLVDDMATTTTWSTLQGGLPANRLIDYPLNSIMHNKYMIVDPLNAGSDPMVLTGSHNWTSSADSKNDENTVIVHDANIANQYYQEFVPRFTQSGGVMGITVSGQRPASLNVYPNPAQNNCTLSFTLANPENAHLTLTDFSGRVISVKTISGKSGENQSSVDTSALAPGVYFMRLDTEEFSGICKIVVNH